MAARTRRSTAAAGAITTLQIEVRCLSRVPPGTSALLGRAARYAARAERFARGSLSIAVVGAEAMARLHREHLNIAGPTDVLTFDLGSDRRRKRLDAEVVVCAPVARGAAGRQRAAAGALQPVQAELALYVVHGLLHLAGYDDHGAADAARMHAREDELLTQIGIGPVYNAAGPRPIAGRGRRTARHTRR